MPGAEEQPTQRMTTIAVMVIAALVGTLLVLPGRDGAPSKPAVVVAASNGEGGTATTTTTTPPSTTTGPAATTTTGTPTTSTTTVDPGALPQTDQRPSASGPTFTAGAADLWEAVRQDRPELGLTFFFPKSAYLQVKAIGDPAGDFQNRLIANFEQDVHAAHAQLGADASSATFVGISVPDDQAVLVQPGEEYNQLSYWRVYGTTIQYQVDGQSGSFPVTSLISWRGEWYVVHLGAIR